MVRLDGRLRTVEMSNMTSKPKFAKNWLCLLLVGTLNLAAPEKPAERTLPVRGFCIPSPLGNRVDEFIKFIEEELASRPVNVLILRGKLTGLGEWEASRNDTHPAVDLIPKD